MKLARNLTIALIAGIFMVLALSAYVRIRREAGLFEANIRRDDHAMGRALMAGVLEVWGNEGEARALHLVDEANEQEGAVDIRWVWLDGQGGPDHAPRLSAAALAPVRAGHEVVQAIVSQGAEQLVTCMPVAVPGGRAGALELAESLAGKREYVRATISSTLVSTAALTLVSGLITTALGVWLVGRPMRALIEQARRIGAGDLTRRISLRQRDEIGELAEEMNRMCDRLLAAHEKLGSETSARIDALEQLRHAERLATVGKLASGIAHELGTPLQIVSGRARMIAEGDVTGAEVEASARTVVEQSQRMTRIIRQLLDFARRRDAQKIRVDLRRVLQDTYALLRPLADKQGVTLAQEGPDTPAEIEADEEQLQQALTNVIVNGVQSMPRGGQLTVAVERVRVRPPADHGGPEADYLALSVRDEGEGIPAEAAAHIFEPFFTTKPVGEGTGLGLSVTYGIIREHGGFIRVESAPGAGSRFTFHFPEGSRA
jgi:signal transduction histidine kinase